MTVCSCNLTYELGRYPQITPEEAWFGDKIKRLRESLANFDFSLGCRGCEKQILADNLRNSILHHYETLLPNTKQLINKIYPSHLVFQLHNTCNYECIMCSGQYSSAIQKNRDKVPLSKNVYDDSFIEKVTPFIARSLMMEFLGGEPFVMSINYKLWEIVKEQNPLASVNIITNGSVYNDKIEDLLKKLPRSAVHVSLDSLDEKTYAYIRRRGNLKNVLENIDNFVKIKKLKSVSVCPMIQNVYELPNIIDFCKEKRIGLFINNVTGLNGDDAEMQANLYENGTLVSDKHKILTEEKIKEFRLWTLPIEEREKIKSFLLSKTYPVEFQDQVVGFTNYLMNYTVEDEIIPKKQQI